MSREYLIKENELRVACDIFHAGLKEGKQETQIAYVNHIKKLQEKLNRSCKLLTAHQHKMSKIKRQMSLDHQFKKEIKLRNPKLYDKVVSKIMEE